MEQLAQEGQIIEGVVEKVIFQNDAGSFSIFVINRTEDEVLQEITCTAQSEIHVGEDVKLMGFFFVHPNYGPQFKAQRVERVMPKTTESMEKYLASGALKGIGPVRAARIVKEFGLEAFDVLENRPEMLSKVKGITNKLALEIGREFAGKAYERNTMMYLQNMGLTANQSKKIWDEYGEESIDTVKLNPYVLAKDIFGIGFKIADGIAAKAGIPHNSTYRISAGIEHILGAALGDGHVFLPKDVLVRQGCALLGLEAAEIENQLLQMQLEGDIKQERVPHGDDGENMIVVYLAAYYHAENFVARRLLELNAAAEGLNADAQSGIREVERESGVVLAQLQKTAVQEVLARGVLVITGGPGTGKTTTIKSIIRIMERLGKSLVLCAPTGRAAKRMSEATGMPASTIHRRLNISPEEGWNFKGPPPEEMMIQEDCVIVDESSMVDVMLMFRLLRMIRPGTRLVLVGDVNQLPSVGPGNVLRDIIGSGKVTVVYLDEIFRQSRQSAIVMNAHRINEGVYPVLNEKTSDFFFIGERDINRVISIISELAAVRLPRFLGEGADAIRDIQVLTPQRKSVSGVANLNIVLQNVLNPADEGKAEKQMGSFVFREGDKVMQIKNNYDTQWVVENEMGAKIDDGFGVFNGDGGIVKKIDNEASIMRVHFDDDRLVEYGFKQLDELVLAYAITIHKSQGSEYDVVILPIHSGPPMLLNRNLLYTAITRAKKLVVIVGIANTLERMVDNIRENVRYSALRHRIEKLYRRWHE